MPHSLITGITGQDGSYLPELSLQVASWALEAAGAPPDAVSRVAAPERPHDYGGVRGDITEHAGAPLAPRAHIAPGDRVDGPSSDA